MKRWGYDETNGVVIGGNGKRGTLHKYSDGSRQGPAFTGDNDRDVIEKAQKWFSNNGGKEVFPNGLELRIY